jgi:hypothetical protein
MTSGGLFLEKGMSRWTELRSGIARAKDRARYAQRQLERFDATTGNSEAEGRTRRKLEADVARAENDVAALEHALAEQPPALSNSEADAFVEGVEVAEDA